MNEEANTTTRFAASLPLVCILTAAACAIQMTLPASGPRHLLLAMGVMTVSRIVEHTLMRV